MTITGRQIREARALLHLKRSIVAQKVGRITTLAITRAEEAGDEPILSVEQAAAVRQTLERMALSSPQRACGCENPSRDLAFFQRSQQARSSSVARATRSAAWLVSSHSAL